MLLNDAGQRTQRLVHRGRRGENRRDIGVQDDGIRPYEKRGICLTHISLRGQRQLSGASIRRAIACQQR